MKDPALPSLIYLTPSREFPDYSVLFSADCCDQQNKPTQDINHDPLSITTTSLLIHYYNIPSLWKRLEQIEISGLTEVPIAAAGGIRKNLFLN